MKKKLTPAAIAKPVDVESATAQAFTDNSQYMVSVTTDLGPSKKHPYHLCRLHFYVRGAFALKDIDHVIDTLARHRDSLKDQVKQHRKEHP